MIEAVPREFKAQTRVVYVIGIWRDALAMYVESVLLRRASYPCSILAWPYLRLRLRKLQSALFASANCMQLWSPGQLRLGQLL